jgi:hypothetical protein
MIHGLTDRKIILKGDRFTAESNFDDFAKIVKRAATLSNSFFGLLPPGTRR